MRGERGGRGKEKEVERERGREKIPPVDSHFGPYPWVPGFSWSSHPNCFSCGFWTCLASPYNYISQFIAINILIHYLLPPSLLWLSPIVQCVSWFRSVLSQFFLLLPSGSVLFLDWSLRVFGKFWFGSLSKMISLFWVLGCKLSHMLSWYLFIQVVCNFWVWTPFSGHCSLWRSVWFGSCKQPLVGCSLW